MNDQNFWRGLFLAAIALVFGIGATRYQIGTFARAGPGLFPLLVSSLLGLIALLTLVRSRLVPRVAMTFNPRSIGLILLALIGFTVASAKLNVAVGTVVLVFVSSLASSPYSWQRNLKITAVLLAVAYAFQYFLGLNLNLPLL